MVSQWRSAQTPPQLFPARLKPQRIVELTEDGQPVAIGPDPPATLSTRLGDAARAAGLLFFAFARLCPLSPRWGRTRLGDAARAAGLLFFAFARLCPLSPRWGRTRLGVGAGYDEGSAAGLTTRPVWQPTALATARPVGAGYDEGSAAGLTTRPVWQPTALATARPVGAGPAEGVRPWGADLPSASSWDQLMQAVTAYRLLKESDLGVLTCLLRRPGISSCRL